MARSRNGPMTKWVSVSRLLQHRLAFNLDARDAVPFHLQHGITPSEELEGIARLRDFLQARQHETAQGLEALISRQLQVELAFEVADIFGAVEHQRAASGNQRGWLRDVKLILDL